VLHGHAGYRRHTMEQFVWAAQNVDRLDPATSRKWIVDNFSTDRIALMLKEYYQSLLNLDRKGWYEENPLCHQLDWLRLVYPGE